MTRVITRVVAFFLVVSVWVPSVAAKRVALVIGNSAYEHAAPLPNPKNDAEAITKSLEELGFEVVKGIDLDHTEFARTVSTFSKRLRGADVGLFFYAGHGLQVNGQNFLAPIDAQLEDETALGFEAVPLRLILKLMERETKINLVFLDACRDNPIARNLARSMGTRSTAIGQGLAREETGLGTFIAFATQPGNVALDGEGSNSPFAAGMLKHIDTPGLDVDLVMRRVREDVIKSTSGTQVPWTNSSLTGTFIFNDRPKEQPPAATANSKAKDSEGPRGIDPLAVELAFWQAAKDAGTRKAYEAYLEKYPKGNFAPLVAIYFAEIDQALAIEAKRQAELDAARKKQAAADKAKRTAEARQKTQSQEAERKKAAEEATSRKAEAEQRERELAELQEKQAVEGEKLAKERDVLVARLKALEEQTRTKAQEKQQEGQAQQVASLQPVTSEPELDTRSLTMVLQNELRRVGCDPGKVDGVWGSKGSGALASFNRHASLNLPMNAPTIEAIEAVKDKTERVCPLFCGQQFNKINDQCVKKTCQGGLQLNSRGQCIKVVAKKAGNPAPGKKAAAEKNQGPTGCLGISFGGIMASKCN